ncbi:hypothetical protein CEXT_619421 [Caerostris extrusa]|uniref:Transposase n=1 Tax=Caerostris extrusa TaxID=172846 RepID=A0AAV4Y8A0_CAEEX|nr:hypothetical protein CEXT_619421 [Caerostris extrusa]
MRERLAELKIKTKTVWRHFFEYKCEFHTKKVTRFEAVNFLRRQPKAERKPSEVKGLRSESIRTYKNVRTKFDVNIPIKLSSPYVSGIVLLCGQATVYRRNISQFYCVSLT